MGEVISKTEKHRICMLFEHYLTHVYTGRYTVLGLCTADHTGATQFQNAHEWLWFKLNHVQRGTGTPPDVSHHADASWLQAGFREVQDKDVWEGTNRGEGFEPLLYFELLMLTAQFERAIEYLRAKQLSRLAVHVAIPLEHCGLLHTSNRLPSRVFGVHGMTVYALHHHYC